MSGGIAYIWDPEGAFPGNCNQEMVDLDPVTMEDDAELRSLIEKHALHGLDGRRSAADPLGVGEKRVR